ncbi:MAG TPA: ATPase, T2SS/T4P/T4SS family, partial [Ramlibacter sp.]|nr:ATPase, T2SS/T4P/T4SS family [Ramlibacter sp.]
MLQVEIEMPDGTLSLLDVPEDSVIGKGAQSEIRLDSWRVGKEHARIFKTPGGVLVEDMGAFGGLQVNGERVDGQYGPLNPSDIIEIGPFKLKVPQSHAPERTAAAVPRVAAPVHAPVAPAPVVVAAPEPTRADASLKQREFEWRKKIHSALIDAMDLRRHDVSRMTDEKLRADTSQLILQIVRQMEDEIPADLDRDLLRKQVLDEAVGLGPLEELLADDGVSEVMVNRFDEIFVERSGRLQRHSLTFTGDRAVLGVIERIVAPLGRRIDESSPMVDARLKDGSRVNAIIPPLALKGPCLTIRKFSKRKLDAQDLVRFGSISDPMAKFLEVCVVGRKNIIVSGGTGSGKTTLLNILSNFIPPTERVITVEDAAELKL